LLFAFISSFGNSDFSEVNIAVIPIEGVILTSHEQGILTSKITSSQDIVSYIDAINEDDSIDAILFEINSPGGSAVASKEIVNAMKRCKKPKYALVREMATSAAYWIASAVDKKIVANEFSIVGNIGVISSYLEFSGLLDDYNITYNRLVAGEHKDIGDPFRPLTKKEKKMLEEQLSQVHAIFFSDVMDNRNIEDAEIQKELKTAMFYVAVQGKEFGLVDELGDKKTLEGIIKKDFKTETIYYTVYRKKVTFADMFSQAINKISYYLGQGIGQKMFAKNRINSPFQMIN